MGRDERKTSRKLDDLLVFPVVDVASGKLALPPSIAPIMVQTIVGTQDDLNEVATQKKGFHELGVIKMIAHLFIVVVQRGLSTLGFACKFESVDESLIQK